MSEREDLANRIEAFLKTHFTNVSQDFIPRDDSTPGMGRQLTWSFNNRHYQLVVWNLKRLDFHSDNPGLSAWWTFGTEQEFYDFIESTFLRGERV